MFLLTDGESKVSLELIGSLSLEYSSELCCTHHTICCVLSFCMTSPATDFREAVFFYKGPRVCLIPSYIPLMLPFQLQFVSENKAEELKPAVIGTSPGTLLNSCASCLENLQDAFTGISFVCWQGSPCFLNDQSAILLVFLPNVDNVVSPTLYF